MGRNAAADTLQVVCVWHWATRWLVLVVGGLLRVMPCACMHAGRSGGGDYERAYRSAYVGWYQDDACRMHPLAQSTVGTAWVGGGFALIMCTLSAWWCRSSSWRVALPCMSTSFIPLRVCVCLRVYEVCMCVCVFKWLLLY